MRVGRGVVAEEGGDVDGVRGEVPEVEGVEVECWMGVRFLVHDLGGLVQWVGDKPRTMRIATR
jgi:hypothetical protein